MECSSQNFSIQYFRNHAFACKILIRIVRLFLATVAINGLMCICMLLSVRHKLTNWVVDG